MTTKTEAFRRKAERTRPPRKKKPQRARRDIVVDTAEPGVSATDRKAGDGHTGERNRAEGGELTVAFEDSTTPRPSRKSTRRSAQRKKASSALERHNQLKATRPSAKATRKKATKRAKPAARPKKAAATRKKPTATRKKATASRKKAG